MKLSERIVIKLPLDSLWTDSEELDAERIQYLGLSRIKELLRKGPVQFVIANVGDKLAWQELEKAYDFYKSNVKNHLIEDRDHIDLDRLKENFGYLASKWEIKSGNSLILLEVIH